MLFRADIDALPVTEDSGLDYASTATATDADGVTVGVMHACGHDSHITCALGAASLLSSERDLWAGTYVALFQPAEEVGKGARSMVDDGLVDKSRGRTSASGSTCCPAPRRGRSRRARGRSCRRPTR